MSTLRNLSLIDAPPGSVFSPRQFVVGNNSTGVTDGGACCCWIPPSGTSAVTFEMWGAGGDGAGACCCSGPYVGGGTGEYTKVTLQLSSAYYILCAGGSGCCAQSCCATPAFPSFARNAAGTLVGCATGGTGACTVCGHMAGHQCTGICIASMTNSCGVVGDFRVPGTTGVDKQNNFCTNYSFEFLSGSNKFRPNTRHSADSCSMGMTVQGCTYFQGGAAVLTWPAGGGPSAQACGGGCCWGTYGSGGLVVITYG